MSKTKESHQFIWIVWGFLILLSCKDENHDPVNNLNVSKYIEALKSNQYHEDQLPEFIAEDIPALLEYRNETRIITDFPRNPISSYYRSECSLGLYVLWTIESIRARSINSEFLLMGFPSQNPILELKEAEGSEFVSAELSQEPVAKAYFDWWESNKSKDFEEFKHMDPLEALNFRWH
jgi:hypothetical protein